MHRSSLLVWGLTAALLAGCAAAPSAPPTPGGGAAPSSGPTPSVSPTVAPAPGAPTVAPTNVLVYFDRAEKMQAAARTVSGGTKAVLRAAVTALLQGPSASERSTGLRTLIPSGTTLNGVSIAGTVATIDLSSRFASGGGTLSMTNRLAQVVFTATQFPAVSAVRFKLDGKTIAAFGGEGIVLEGPQARVHYEGASPAILVEVPAWAATVKRGMIARGTADVFEGVFRLQLRDANGDLVFDRTVHATSGTGTRGDWSEILTWTSGKPGRGSLKVFAQSAKDGSPVDVVTIPVVLAE